MTFNLTVDGTKPFDQFISECGTEFKQGEPGERPIFKITNPTKREVAAAIFHFNVEEMKPAEVVEKMNKNGYVPAQEEHLLSYITTNPIIPDMCLVALGAERLDGDLNEYVFTCTTKDSTHEFGGKITGKGWGPWVNEKYHFLAFKNQ